MMRRAVARVVAVGWIGTAVTVGCQSPPGGDAIGVATSNVVLETTDWSGRIHQEVVICKSSVRRQRQTVSCSLDPSYVLTGGGALAVYTGAGALLTESKPVTDGLYRTWVASSKDHNIGDSHDLEVYAIGIRLDGVARDTLVNQMEVTSSTSGTQTGETLWQAAVEEGYTLLGGGATVNWTGEGSLLTRSSPYPPPENRTWLAADKDHVKASSASLTVYAIGILPVIPGFGTLEVATRVASATVQPKTLGQVTVSADTGWVDACPGAGSDWRPGEGRLLVGIVPLTTPTGVSTAKAVDKDHVKADGGTLYSFTRQIRLKP